MAIGVVCNARSPRAPGPLAAAPRPAARAFRDVYGAEQSLRALERRRLADGYESVNGAKKRGGEKSRIQPAVQWLEKNPAVMAQVGANVRAEIGAHVSSLGLPGAPEWRALQMWPCTLPNCCVHCTTSQVVVCSSDAGACICLRVAVPVGHHGRLLLVFKCPRRSWRVLQRDVPHG